MQEEAEAVYESKEEPEEVSEQSEDISVRDYSEEQVNSNADLSEMFDFTKRPSE